MDECHQLSTSVFQMVALVGLWSMGSLLPSTLLVWAALVPEVQKACRPLLTSPTAPQTSSSSGSVPTWTSSGTFSDTPPKMTRYDVPFFKYIYIYICIFLTRVSPRDYNSLFQGRSGTIYTHTSCFCTVRRNQSTWGKHRKAPAGKTCFCCEATLLNSINNLW